ncbi:M50 family metallopeptidase [Desmospora profundinema]|uniref:Stage IV sporulation protein FB n=1 Tax=Desmospora profundinema TaxID=1571184 RepID=A0ABU1INP7_9BACL|nr:M50 family metallopeptidase [Desmospora profundinema]MDR6226407.1 stage IV sporulation protein FB [Desmospora profundinema]
MIREGLPWQGIRFRIHFLFGAVLLASVITGQFMEVITLFVLVLIHELGHVTAARSFGWRMKTIELLPFGGVAQTDEWGTVSAREEIAVALAGPFHNVIMILTGILFFRAGWWSEEWMLYFVQGNALMAGFNLLPLYPLDGGRILQALLSYRLPYRQAIQWTFHTGVAGAGLLLVYTWFVGEREWNLTVIGLFLLQANWIAYRKREFQLMRFLLYRREHGVDPAAPILRVRVNRDEPLVRVFRRFRKEAYHVIEVKDSVGAWRALPEEALFQHYFDGKNTRGVVGDLTA